LDVAKAAQKLTLTHSEASHNLRLTEALTYPSVQGRTLRDKHILLMDANERSHFSSRHLVVGLSRATHGKYVHVAQERQSRVFVKTGEMTPSTRGDARPRRDSHRAGVWTNDARSSRAARGNECPLRTRIRP
jgi:hypothetical protein